MMSLWSPRETTLPGNETRSWEESARWTPSSELADAPATSVTVRERLECGFEGCAAGWMKKFRRRARPIFEDEWGCSRACVRGLVSAAVRREMEGADGTDVAEEHQHRIPLGLMLLAQGLVTKEQLRTALEAQKLAGHGRIGQWLVEAAGVSSMQVTRGIGMQWQCPVLGLNGFDAKRMVLAMPVALRRLCGVAPLRVAGGKILYLAFDESVDAAAAFALERMSGLSVESGVASASEFREAVEALDRFASVPCSEVEVHGAEEMSAYIGDVLHRLQPVASKLVRLRSRYWLRMWLEHGAFSKHGTLPRTGEDVVDVLLQVRR